MLEPEPVLLRALQHGLGPSPALAADPRVQPARAKARLPRSATAARYDIVDLSADFLDAAEANATAFSVRGDRRLSAGAGAGRDRLDPGLDPRFPGLRPARCWRRRAPPCCDAGVADPAAHMRGLSLGLERAHPAVQPPLGCRRGSPPCANSATSARSTCPGIPGIDPSRRARRASTTTCRPCRSPAARSTSDGPDDAIADEAGAVLAGAGERHRSAAFNLAPITLDRPFFYAVLRLGQLGTILKRLEILPQAEIGALVNLAVLAQAVVIAALVLLVPLLAPAGCVRPEAGAAAAARLFPGARPGLPVHRDLPDREGELLAERPDSAASPWC